MQQAVSNLLALARRRSISHARGCAWISSKAEPAAVAPPGLHKTPTTRTVWVCDSCGATSDRWSLECRICGGADTSKRSTDTSAGSGGWTPLSAELRSLSDVNSGLSGLDWRIPLPGVFGTEIARVLGGGIVPGSLILVGGDPGVGKSTLLLQIASLLTETDGGDGPNRVLYVSGEESIQQIKGRAERMRIVSPDILLCTSCEIKEILKRARAISPRAIVIDSVQSVHLEGVKGSTAGVKQVKECAAALLWFAKQTNVPIFLIGHVTKTGGVAGPRTLEHMVDAVLYVESGKNPLYRLLRSVKNRFGSTDELGIFEMSSSGIQAILNPSEIFLSKHKCESDVFTGHAIAPMVDGSQLFLVKIQALCSDGRSGYSIGVPKGRATMIVSVLMKQAGLKLQNVAVFLNVTGGSVFKETAGDLAVAAAICSSCLEVQIPHDTAFIGEIGLGGELRMVPRMDKRVIRVGKPGFKRCVVPNSAVKALSLPDATGIEILGCKNLKELIGVICGETNTEFKSDGSAVLGARNTEFNPDDEIAIQGESDEEFDESVIQDMCEIYSDDGNKGSGNAEFTSDDASVILGARNAQLNSDQTVFQGPRNAELRP